MEKGNKNLKKTNKKELDSVSLLVTDPPTTSFTTLSKKLDGVGPVDNRPSTD